MSTAIEAPQDGTKKNEFNDGRVRAPYTWGESFKDWFKQGVSSKYTDAKVEEKLLSVLPFFPESDGTRIGKVINTPIGDGKYIHEFYIENTEKPANKDETMDIVLVHGYAASLGLFIDNFDSLSSIPGIKIHAIDLLGFGFSSRPKFPNFPSNTKADIYKVEDWFIDSMEAWRKKRNLNKFILLGHSFGGYLSCAYVLKYNKNLIDVATGKNLNPVEKLVLISPVGVERSKYSLFKQPGASLPSSDNSSSATRVEADPIAREAELTKEFTANQEDIVHPVNSNSSIKTTGSDYGEVADDEIKSVSRGQKLFHYLWKNNYSPFGIVRNIGPLKSKFISGWTSHRFSHVYVKDPDTFYAVHDYIYRIFNGKGSGEYAITRILDLGALAKLPLIDRCPESFSKMNLPTLWMYGDKDWMNEKAGYQMTKDINKVAERKLASYAILPNAGHHLYLDNPQAFSKTIFKFLNFKK
ncbi:hypothetical protein CLIB1423_29S00342 [[Candida] railenensis]|uniref:AB hydrolase-1 domain-containing protein n=1 Tax=[Candida] railenensis TaxID=45579 RepID=A0A9P0W108_9ASCO|nr:hypothetical protein CLIB1423_29S00342 [[Candida] railenensis]